MNETAAKAENTELSPREARERLEHADAHLHKRWLWPEIAVDEWQAALYGLERTVRDVLVTGRGAAPLDGDPAATGVAAYTSGIGPLLGFWLEAGVIDATADLRPRLARHLAHNRERMALMSRRARHIVEALSDGGVEPTILKGMHTAFVYFPEPGTRALSDIDILIDPADYKRAAAALSAAGLQPGLSCFLRNGKVENWSPIGERREPRTLDLVHRADPWSIDLHMTLNRKNSVGSSVLELDRAGLRDKAARWSVSERASVLSGTSLLFHLLVHASDLHSLSLARMVELAFVVRREVRVGRADWDEVLTMARKARAQGAIWPALAMTENLCPGLIPGNILESSRDSASEGMRRVLGMLSPGDAQNVRRASLSERLMWTPSLAGKARHFAEALLVPGASLKHRFAIYRSRIRRLAGIAWGS